MRTFILIVIGIVLVSMFSGLFTTGPVVWMLDGAWWTLICTASIWLILIAVGLSVMVSLFVTLGITIVWVFFSALFSFWPLLIIALGFYLYNQNKASA